MEIGKKLNEDAVGAWFRAETEDGPGTLRRLREDLQDNEGARVVFLEEVRRIKRLSHPFLIRTLRTNERDALPWALTEPIDNGTLEESVAASGAWKPEAALELVGRLIDLFELLEQRRQLHVCPAPSRIVRVGDDWKLTTFREIRAWDELKGLKGKHDPAPLFAPPERAKGTPQPMRPQPFLPWYAGALLRFLVGGGAARTDDGAVAPIPEGLPCAGEIRALTAAETAQRPQGIAAIRRALTAADGPAAKPLPAAPIPRRRRKR